VNAVAAVARFLYGFVVGDDWTVALVMLLALAGTAVLTGLRVNTWWLVPALAVVMTGVSLYRRRPG
jgi:hypothetical protein